MAPDRLLPKNVRNRAAIRQPHTFRFWLIARTPTILIDYLFEVLLAAFTLLSGIGYLTGFSSSRSILRLLPDTLAMLFEVVLILGALAVIAGLIFRKYGTIVPRGLTLLATAVLAYSISAIFYAGIRTALFTILMSLAWAALSAWRAFILRSTFILLSTRGTSDEAPERT